MLLEKMSSVSPGRSAATPPHSLLSLLPSFPMNGRGVPVRLFLLSVLTDPSSGNTVGT